MFEGKYAEIALAVIACFFAVTSLVRLMQRQRRIVLAKLEQEVAAEKQRQEAEKHAKTKEKSTGARK